MRVCESTFRPWPIADPRRGHSRRRLRSSTRRSTRASSWWRGWSIRSLIVNRSSMAIQHARARPYSALDTPGPGVSECEGRGLAQQVDAVRGDSELEDLVLVREIQREGAPELGQRGVRASEVVGLGVEPDVDVLREARLRVIDEGQSADDQVAHAVAVEQVEEVLEVLDRVHVSRACPCARPPRFRRRGGWRPSAESRSSGLCVCQNSRSQASASAWLEARWATSRSRRRRLRAAMAAPSSSLPIEAILADSRRGTVALRIPALLDRARALRPCCGE